MKPRCKVLSVTSVQQNYSTDPTHEESRQARVMIQIPEGSYYDSRNVRDRILELQSFVTKLLSLFFFFFTDT